MVLLECEGYAKMGGSAGKMKPGVYELKERA